MMRSTSGALLALLVVSLAPPATASTTFPEALRKQLDLPQIVGPAPGCRLCHQDDLGGLKTATKPLGRSLLKAGAMGGSVPSLLAALTTLESDGTDSDGDGIGDISELKGGTDPNAPPEGSTAAPLEDIPLPQTGCSLSAVRTDSTTWPYVAAALALCALRRRRDWGLPRRSPPRRNFRVDPRPS